ncbi:hypothetical protein B0H13DRAFT_2195892 [Mycena leptocephala]|nr:hypothetical protein B0H13DRAFT_2195892 [Mycena leptocephala]
MFGLVTVHYALNFNNVYNGLMVNIVPHIAEETHLLAGADMIFMISDFSSQLILIYRCYLVWGKTIWVIILPLFMAFATVSCGLALVGLVLSISPTAPQAPEAIVPMGTATFAISLALNLMVTGLIVSRIWWMTRDNRKQGVPHSKNSISRAMEIVVESGMLFLGVQFAFVVLFALEHPAQAVVEPIATQVYAIAPMLIIVRVGMGTAYEQTTKGPMSSVRFMKFNKRVETTMDDTVRNSSTLNVELSQYKGDSKGTLTDTLKDRV